MKSTDFFQKLTDNIIEELNKGKIPWEQPWFSNSAINVASGKPYRGINQLNLAMTYPRLKLDTNDMRFLTFNQAKQKGWSVKKGSKAVAEVIFFSMLEKDTFNEDGEKETFPILKRSLVFHASQIEGIGGLKEQPAFKYTPNEVAEKIVKASKAKILEHPSRAFFSSQDYIAMPKRESFKSTEAYYGVLLHELAHWTGHPSRLNRGIFNTFGSEDYAREELVAELASVFLCAETGIQYVAGNHTAYIQNWVRVLKNDPFEIKRASARATKVVEYLLNLAGLNDYKEIF